MKVTSMQLVPANGSDPCVLSFRDPRRLNPYNVMNIDGLDADQIVAKNYGPKTKSTTFTLLDPKPTKYYELSVLKREPVFQIQLNPRPSLGESYSSLRDDLARMIASTRTGEIQILFMNGLLTTAAITGRVQKFESDLFAKTPTVTITFTCPDGMLRDPVATDVGTAGLSTTSATIVDNDSTAPHGFRFSAKILSETDTFTIQEPDYHPISGPVVLGTWEFTIAPVGGFQINDTIAVSSETNNKYVKLLRGFTTKHIADAVVPGSVWPLIFPGDTRLGLVPSSDTTWLSISHYKTYWGV